MSINDEITSLENMAKQKISEIHTAIPAKIISFDAATCTAVVKPTLMCYTADDGLLEYPLITGVPVFMPRAGSAQITYPVKADDSCLLIFSERSIDVAWQRRQ